jgi:hypothetical protein
VRTEVSVVAASRTYRRKLSHEDAETGTLLITKDRWSMFPPPMTEFPLDVAGARFETRIVAEDCACVPPPHQHLHLELGHVRDRLDFGKGAVVEVERTGDAYVVRNG